MCTDNTRQSNLSTQTAKKTTKNINRPMSNALRIWRSFSKKLFKGNIGQSKHSTQTTVKTKEMKMKDPEKGQTKSPEDEESLGDCCQDETQHPFPKKVLDCVFALILLIVFLGTIARLVLYVSAYTDKEKLQSCEEIVTQDSVKRSVPESLIGEHPAPDNGFEPGNLLLSRFIRDQSHFRDTSEPTDVQEASERVNGSPVEIGSTAQNGNEEPISSVGEM